MKLTNIIKKQSSNILLATLAFSLSGCATIFSGTTQDINVKVVEEGHEEALENVSCKITDAGGAEYVLPTTPGVAHVRRGEGTLTIVCKKDGYKQQNVAVGDSFNKVALVNILFWPGLIVDGMSGAYKKYPSHYVVSMKKQ